MIMTDTLVDVAPYRLGEGEEYMNEKQRKHFRGILLAWKQQLMEEGRRTVSSMQDEPLNLPDPNDRASQEEEFSINLRARDRERKLLHKIDKALGRLASDDYGYCEACGVEIGLRRLEARPTAELCIDCKHLEEQREKSQAA
ncbi:MAG: RNA polymerase-binding protein DksA [Candidatus Competibacteraceae bacterium]|nr:MAG: RNA polymerase-binding protein DksA [Candidatus Competibacteraceae bacterium]